jgi:TRAP-type C4-dicarboxylate transport system substrate-binding protein
MAIRIRRSRSDVYETDAWILEQAALLRAQCFDELTESLRSVVESELPEDFERARERAATSLRKHGEDAAAAALPAICPYTLDQIVGDWLP